MTKREAKKWIRQHWATLIWNMDCPHNCPDAVANIFGEESQKLAVRLGLYKDFDQNLKGE